VVIKSGVVERDEKESGERRKLNFGHTFGHALEKANRVPHGQAVSVGMVLASALSEKRAMLSRRDTRRIRRLLERLGLPVRMDFRRAETMEALGKDKKREGDWIHFVLLSGLGKAVVRKIPLGEVRAALIGILSG
jgi:3-dehydroquinate synthase